MSIKSTLISRIDGTKLELGIFAVVTHTDLPTGLALAASVDDESVQLPHPGHPGQRADLMNPDRGRTRRAEIQRENDYTKAESQFRTASQHRGGQIYTPVRHLDPISSQRYHSSLHYRREHMLNNSAIATSSRTRSAS